MIPCDNITWFKPSYEEYAVGRDTEFWEDKGGTTHSWFTNTLEDYIPGFHEFGQGHDSGIGTIQNATADKPERVIDPLTNIPSMPFYYGTSLIANTIDTTVDIARPIVNRTIDTVVATEHKIVNGIKKTLDYVNPFK
jgi:hypothetical protein